MLIRANSKTINFDVCRYSLQQEGNLEFIYDEFEDSVLLESVVDAAYYIDQLENDYVMFVWECKQYIES